MFSIKDNKFLGLNLNDQADYSTHFYNIIENKIGNLDLKMQKLDSKVEEIKNDMNKKMDEIKNDMKKQMDEINKKIDRLLSKFNQ